MAITLPVRDWPPSVRPSASLFIAGGQARAGGMTVRSVMVEHPEPGGRAMMDWTFSHMKTAINVRQAAWLMSMVANGTLWQIKLPVGEQLVGLADLGLVDAGSFAAAGLPWDSEQPWSNGQNWDLEVGVRTDAAALEGAVVVRIDMGTLANGLNYGHVIGIADADGWGRAYHVEDISYAGDVATVTISPPLRADVADNAYVTFRPKMLATVPDPSPFRQLLEFGSNVRPGSIRFVEALP